MKRPILLRASILAVALAAAGLGIGAEAARADVITLDASGSMSAVVGSGTTCAPTGCMLGGNIVINNTTGFLLSPGVTISGGSPSVGPFTFADRFGVIGGLTFLGLRDGAGDLLRLIFSTPTPGSLIGYTGGLLDPSTSILLSSGTTAWTLTSGSLTEATAVPEASSLMLLLIALAGLLGKCIRSKRITYG